MHRADGIVGVRTRLAGENDDPFRHLDKREAEGLADAGIRPARISARNCSTPGSPGAISSARLMAYSPVTIAPMAS